MIASEIDVWIAIIDKALKAHDIAQAEAKFCYEAAGEIERQKIELNPALDTWLQWRGGCERTEYDS